MSRTAAAVFTALLGFFCLSSVISGADRLGALKLKADQGDTDAQYNLGVMYDKGDEDAGVPQNGAEARDYFRKAADQGHAAAQNKLGMKYASGEWVPQDYAEAVKWFRKAVEQGHANAQNNLGTMYDSGDGVKKDYAEAVKWYRKAADQGDADAQYNLGMKYASGQGVPQDYLEAAKWYGKAADQGHADAQNSAKVVGTKVYLVDTCGITSLPIWQGEAIENGKPGTALTVVAVEEDGHWYKVKTTAGKFGYIGTVWVTTDGESVKKKIAEEARQKAEEKAAEKAEEAKQKAAEEQAKKEKLADCRKKHPSWDCTTIVAGKVRIGMNMEQCRASWGEPAHISNTTYASGTNSQWCYGDYCSSALYFENGILTAIQN